MKEQNSQGGESRLVSAYVDIATLRSAGIAKPLYEAKVDNIVTEMLLGGVLANLKHTSFAAGALTLNQSGIQLQWSLPHQRDWEPPREYFFGEEHLAVLRFAPER